MPELEGQTDGQLLKAFAEKRDEEAFAELVRRHGPLVWSVCRRVLGRSADIEDAAQAAFLALARQGPRWRALPSAGAWLHRVAHDIAVNLLGARKARERREKEAATMAQPTNPPAALSDEQGALLHDELNALPEKYRQAVILCHLEGKSLEQAAAVLACPKATVGTWVARGRERLKDRLARRGLILSLALLTSLLSAEAGAAELPATFIATTSKAASLFVAGEAGAGIGASALSSRIASLAEGALRKMFYANLRMAVLIGVLFVCIGGGTGWIVSQAKGAEGRGQGQKAVTPSTPAVAPTPVTPTVTRDRSVAPVTEDERKSVVEGNNAFAVDLYGKLKDNEKGNLFFSPYSISTALAMTYAGARGSTADQMRKTLHFALNEARLHPAFSGLIETLNAGGKGNYELVVANSLWGDKTVNFEQPFLDLEKAFYGGGLNQVNFSGEAESARRTINTWVEDKTSEKIKDLIPEGSFDEETRLVLVNAIYFNGQWKAGFDKKLTRNAPFYLSGGQKANVPMMTHAGERRLPYLQRPEFQMVELGYKGKGLSMVLLLPEQADGLAALETQCTAANLAEWIGDLQTSQVNIVLPKFKMTWGTKDLGPKGTNVLPALGMIEPFVFGKADFSGISAEEAKAGLHIRQLFHKAFIDVNEEGTKAAAATAVVGADSMPARFRADHPFLFLIRDTRSGSILFMGRVMDPR